MQGLCALLLVLAGLLACAPALNWREWRAPGSPLAALLPCKPQLAEREVPLAGPPTRLRLAQCDADGATWALAHADVGDPARVGPALGALREALVRNLGASRADDDERAAQVPGMTPQRSAREFGVRGQRPGGAAVQARSAVFAYGTTVWQATVVAPRLDADAVATFFGALRFTPA